MGQCLDKLPHSCGTNRGLQVFAREDGTVDGFCFACDTPVRHPYGGEERKADTIPKPKKKSPEEIAAEIAIIGGYPTVALPERKLGKMALEYFGVKIGMNEKDGKTPDERYYPYTKDGKLTGYKVKLCKQKKMWSVGSLKEVDFFGWEQAITTGAKRLIVTEGEDDAIALKKCLMQNTKEQYKDMIPAVVSLPHGVSSAKKDFLRMQPKINQYFKEVVLAFDMDEAGDRAAADVASIRPSVTRAALPAKDANEAIIQGHSQGLYKAVTFNIQKPKNSKLIFGEDLHEEAREAAKFGELTWPFEHLNKTTRGIRYGETIYIGAGVKMGKSEVLNAVAAHFIKEHGVKVFMAKPEEANKKTYKLLAGKMEGKVFHDPEVEFDNEAYDRAGEMLKGKLGMVNLYQHMGWEGLKEDIHAAIEWGAKAIFIDPITNLTNGIPAAEANIKLQEIAQEAAAIALDNQVVIFFFCHLKSPEGNLSKDQRAHKYRDGQYYNLGNCPHELGGDVMSSQFAGSRAMMRSCNLMIGMEGNKDPDLPDDVRRIRNLKLLEDREFGESGNFPLMWNRKTTMFQEL